MKSGIEEERLKKMSNSMKKVELREMKRTEAGLQSQPRVRILLPVMPGEGEQVEVCVNGYWTVIRRGVAVDVPDSVAQVLRQAEML